MYLLAFDAYPDYDPEIGAAVGFLVIILFFIAGLFKKKSPDSDYEVEYIYEDGCETSVNSDFFAACAYEETGDPAAFMLEYPDPEPTVVYRRVKPKRQPKPKKPSAKDHPLYEDCVSALVSVGHKKTEARKIFESVLLRDGVNSVEEFLESAFRA